MAERSELEVPLTNVETGQDLMDGELSTPTYLSVLTTGFGMTALILSIVGIYGVMSYDVARRTPEIGIRMALGATPAAVLWSVLTQGAKLTLAGTAVGLVGALLLTRYLRTLLYNVSPNDPLALSAAALVLATVALLAVWLPARRATKIDPLQALRSE